ncbi:hypothetical protein GALMADRAFT_240968 [Galerina marginata CBS 339.88]|uniref:EXPERA domain-containing protein n=1 Tax=Galerina marginata (strain CBS 339.88) TaxID=685588 RepID=A0A067TBU8_GALM3|nr:hypothetical protein GALMADRAFT_240968 [Galerina marginata CBS 339.88]
MLVNYEKQTGAYSRYAQLPLTARPLDLLYFLFFAMHLPASLIIDLQYIYPPQLVPGFLRGLLDMYIDMSRDPLIGGVHGAFGDSGHLMWFKTFLVLEAVFQIPVFVLGLRGLYKGSQSIYPLLVLYGASSATTTLACITAVLQTPELTDIALSRGVAAVTSQQRLMLLSSYVPFFLVPLIMAADMAFRVSTLVRKGIKMEEEEKWK